MKTEAEMFSECDEMVGPSMIVFSDLGIATRYLLHRYSLGHIGLIAMAEDTREQSGLCVIFRDPVPPERLAERQGNCLWLLEETLAGRQPWPQPGETGPVTVIGGDVRRN